MPLFEDVDLIILATVSPAVICCPLLSIVAARPDGRAPVLIISERSSSPESDDRITFLNFPFDMDGLPLTGSKILDERSPTSA